MTNTETADTLPTTFAQNYGFTERYLDFKNKYGTPESVGTAMSDDKEVILLDLKCGTGWGPEHGEPWPCGADDAAKSVACGMRDPNSLETEFLEVQVYESEVYQQDGCPILWWPTGNKETFVESIHPSEPPCHEGLEHDWQSPHEFVGGLKEDPGVFSSGPGIFLKEVCMTCGCSYLKDQGAHNTIDGRVVTKITYIPGEFAEEVVLHRHKGKLIARMDPRKTGLGFYNVLSLHKDLEDAVDDYSADDGTWFAWVEPGTSQGEEMRPDEYEVVDDEEIGPAILAAQETWEKIIKFAETWGRENGGRLGETWNSASQELVQALYDVVDVAKVEHLSRDDRWDDIHNAAVAAYEDAQEDQE